MTQITRLDIYKLLSATNEILGKTEIKGSLSAKEIYSVGKLNRKLTSENNRTATRQEQLRGALAEALKKEDITEDEKTKLNEDFGDDWRAIWEEETPNPVEVKIPFERSEKILQSITKADVTNCVMDLLIDEPKE